MILAVDLFICCWFVDLLIYYLQVTEPDQIVVGSYYKMGVS